MTLSNIRGHLLTASVPMRFFVYRCTALDKISPDIGRRAVPLRQLSLVFTTTQTVVVGVSLRPSVNSD